MNHLLSAPMKKGAEHDPSLSEVKDSLSEAVRKRIMRAFSPLEREVLARIFKRNPHAHPDCLKVIRKEADEQGPLLLQYECWSTPRFRHPYYNYVFVHAHHKSPEFLGTGRRVNIAFEKHPGTCLIESFGPSGNFKRIYRWK